MVYLRFACQVSAAPHSNGACRYFCQPGYHNYVGVMHGATKARSKGKGNRKAIAHSYYNVCNKFRALKMLFFVYWWVHCFLFAVKVGKNGIPLSDRYQLMHLMHQ